ncbi:hypothetical protein [Streptomyces ureilyticus]|uniref:Uncharacterized protein n=1 Tax=Streptomyces ureilyticus TaxID=1775131 RepID=A0ABX0DFH6_9ACTN|nr:hypothetical protein [Streptomyces ureilyticus]NGO40626.1 hypothetical protein [Streptomyces ureilyticus]
MIPSKQLLPTITPPGIYRQLVQLITVGTELDEPTAERLADSLLFRLGLYGPTPEKVDDWCTAMFFAAYPEGSGWVQCSKEPGHIRRGDPLHKAWRGRSWSDDHRQAVAAVDQES